MGEYDSELEARRLAALRQLDVLDTGPEAPFENIVAIVRTVLSVPMAMVTLVDAERQWFKARVGVDETETPRNISFCTHAVAQDTPLVIPDAAADLRFAANPLVTAGLGIGSYAGVQLTTTAGFHVGTLCAIDTRPRTYTDSELTLLSEFAKVVVNELELHRRADRDHLTGARWP
jgi:GAF domain-containing protein